MTPLLAWLVAAAASLPAGSPGEARVDAPVAAVESTCPPAKAYPPRYPADMLRLGKKGTAVVEARTDDCGRVLEVRLGKSSGQKQLNAAAMAAVAGFVLPKSEATEMTADGWVVVPIRFGGVRTVNVREIPWPASHKRPAYRLDEQPIGYASIDAFRASRTEDNDVPTRQPFASTRDAAGNRISTTLHADRSDPGVFWFSYIVQPMTGNAATGVSVTPAIARLRLVEEAGEPVVRLAILCEVSEAECARFQAMLLDGLPFAKPR